MRTKRDFYKELKEKHGITTSSMFHTNLDEKISDEDYERKLCVMSSINSFFDAKFKENKNR